jgi:hypothetical protein
LEPVFSKSSCGKQRQCLHCLTKQHRLLSYWAFETGLTKNIFSLLHFDSGRKSLPKLML